MDANIQNQGGKELAERIKANLAEPQHRYELHDPFAETTFRFQTAEAATAKADELGASRFQHRDADGAVKQVDKVDGQWWVRNAPLAPQNSQQPPAQEDKPLASVQATIDRDSLSAIEARAEQRAGVGQGFDTDKEMALADAHAFRRIQDPALQESAAVDMANNARAYPEYKAGLDKAIPGYPGTAERVYALDAALHDKVAAKEDRKAQEYAAMIAEREERAKNWTPEEAAKQAQRDSEDYRAQGDTTERGYMRDDMALNAKASPHYKEALEKAAPDVAQDVTGEKARVEELRIDPADLERVAAARARDAAQVRDALGLNSVEPNIEKEQQQLSEAQDAQRAAWLKKADAANAQGQANSKAPGGNQVESDEIFTATQSEIKPAVPAEIEKQYLRVGDKFYHPKNTDLVAFEDKGNKLETKSNSEAIAESMVRIAEARGWDEIKVSGSETFRKEVWLEAASRGMHVKGYSPSEQDKAELAKRMSQTEANKVEKDNKPFRARENEDAKEVKAQAEPPKVESPNKRMAESFARDSPEEAVKKHPELAGAAAAVAVMDKKAEADGLNPQQRAIVMARVRQNVVNSIERGNIPEVKVKEEIEVKREAKEEKERAR
jgi:hypothetical protein